MTTRKIKFKCPKCGDETLCINQLSFESMKVDEEMEDDRFLSTDYTLDYELDSILSIGCFKCGFVVGSDVRDTCKWLIDNGMTEITE